MQEAPKVVGECDEEVELTVLLPSGETLAQVVAGGHWTGAEVKSALHQFLAKGEMIHQLCFGLQIFGDTQTVKQFGLLDQIGQTVLTATMLAAPPCIHFFEPFSTMHISLLGHGPDPDGDFRFRKEDVQHHSMDSVPAFARDVAMEIRARFEIDDAPLTPWDDDIPIVTDGYRITNEVIVVTNVGDDVVQGFLRALDLHPEEDGKKGEDGEEVWESWCRPELDEKDWSQDLVGLGFKRENLEDGLTAKLIATTDVMAKNLTRQFQFVMGTRHRYWRGPLFWGGHLSDGSIVGILSTFMRPTVCPPEVLFPFRW